MTSIILNRVAPIQTYLINDNNNGVFQHHFNDINSFVTTDVSSTRSDASKYNVFSKENNFWMSENNVTNTLKEFISFELNHHVIKLSNLSIKSCDKNDCFKDFDVLGSNTGDNWESICQIREDYSYFMGSIRNIGCHSDFFYKNIKFAQVSADNYDKSYFTFHYIDLFGELLQIKINYCTLKVTFPHLYKSLFLFTILNKT